MIHIPRNDYVFFRASNRIYRVFGSVHPENAVICLLRYWTSGGAWQKPIKYGTERQDKKTIALYDNLTFYPWCGIQVGIMPIEGAYELLHNHGNSPSSKNIKPQPTPSEVDKLLSILEKNKINADVIGSNLVGNTSKNSDIDIAIHNIASKQEAIDAIKKINLSPIIPDNMKSEKLASFNHVSNYDVRSLQHRNCFLACLNGVKVDIHFSRNPHTHNNSTLREIWDENFWSISHEKIFLGEVIDDRNSIFYPVEIDVLIEEMDSIIKCYSLDPAFHFIQKGDRILFTGQAMRDQHIPPHKHIVAKKLLKVECRS